MCKVSGTTSGQGYQLAWVTRIAAVLIQVHLRDIKMCLILRHTPPKEKKVSEIFNTLVNENQKIVIQTHHFIQWLGPFLWKGQRLQ
uniref:Uncharacterized protein n=1 Tax=Timema monikensis TaxID=170555 RepID=A0A7R9HMF3_9NEOP|nr:unnamed protein product [Timema monikensis]